MHFDQTIDVNAEVKAPEVPEMVPQTPEYTVQEPLTMPVISEDYTKLSISEAFNQADVLGVSMEIEPVAT